MQCERDTAEGGHLMNNPWIKLATVSFAGLLISFALLWGIQQFNSYQYYNGYAQYGYDNNGMMNTGMTGNVNASAGMNMQNGTISAGMNASGNMNSGMGMGMSGNMNSGMGMGMNSNMNSSSNSSMQSSGSSSSSMSMMDDGM